MVIQNGRWKGTGLTCAAWQDQQLTSATLEPEGVRGKPALQLTDYRVSRTRNPLIAPSVTTVKTQAKVLA